VRASSPVENERPETVVRRIRKFAFYAYVLMVIPTAVFTGWEGALGLTCSAAVVMINFLWLEQILGKTLQSAPQAKAWRVAVRTMARFALFGVALSVAIFVVRFNSLSILLGFSVIVIGIMGEAVYSVFRSLKRPGR